MSHVTKMNFVVSDLDALEKAANHCGLKLNRGAKTYRSYQHGLTCEHSLSIADHATAYEMGLVRRQDGKGFDLMFDTYGQQHGILAMVAYDAGVGREPNKLRDWYTAEVTRKAMAKQGFMVKIDQQERKVQVLCRK